jgi:heme exporter protein A
LHIIKHVPRPGTIAGIFIQRQSTHLHVDIFSFVPTCFARQRLWKPAMTLAAHQLSCQRGERQLFSGLQFVLQGGDALRIVGANGSGKSSLLRIMCGLALPQTGQVLWQGQDIRRLREEYYGKLIYFGHANGVKDDLLAWENLVIGATLSGQSVSRERAYAALEQLGLGAAADLPTRALSQGQRKRVALARLQLGMNLPLWILDEPFTALDQAAVNQLIVTLDAHLAGGGMVIYTTHQEITLGSGRMACIDLNQGGPDQHGAAQDHAEQNQPC